MRRMPPMRACRRITCRWMAFFSCSTVALCITTTAVERSTQSNSQSINYSTDQWTDHSVNQSVNKSICQSTDPSTDHINYVISWWISCTKSFRCVIILHFSCFWCDELHLAGCITDNSSAKLSRQW